MHQPSILLTGATGLLGRACLPHLIARHGAERILALVRRGRNTSELKALGIGCLPVDLGEADLGLTAGVTQAVARSVRYVIHSAADIRFGVPLEELRGVNVVGTENLLRFAGRCPHLERFAHVSTVYVWGGRPGHLPEEAAEPGDFYNSYQQTKFEAEGAVLAAMARVPASIYRFSTMVYDRSAQCVRQVNYFHQLLRLAAVNPLPAIPALAGAKVDLIASDWAAQVFELLFAEHWRAGEIVHVCAGPAKALTVGELFELSFDLLGHAERRPRIVSDADFEENAAAILSTPSRRQMWQSLASFLPHMKVEQSFACDRLAGAIADRREFGVPDPALLVRDVLSYCVRTRWRQMRSAELATTT